MDVVWGGPSLGASTQEMEDVWQGCGVPRGVLGTLGWGLRLPWGFWGRRGSLTILVGGVVHTVGAIAVVGDVGVGLGTRGVDHPSLDVGPPRLGECPGIHREVSAHLPQHPCGTTPSAPARHP